MLFDNLLLLFHVLHDSVNQLQSINIHTSFLPYEPKIHAYVGYLRESKTKDVHTGMNRGFMLGPYPKPSLIKVNENLENINTHSSQLKGDDWNLKGQPPRFRVL